MFTCQSQSKSHMCCNTTLGTQRNRVHWHSKFALYFREQTCMDSMNVDNIKTELDVNQSNGLNLALNSKNVELPCYANTLSVLYFAAV